MNNKVKKENMDRKILFVGLGSMLLVGIVTVGVLLFGKPASFRGTTYRFTIAVVAHF